MKLSFIVVLVLCLQCIHGFKILGIYPLGGSHYMLGRALMRALAEKGHKVSVISPVGEKDAPENYRDIPINEIWDSLEDPNPTKKKNFFERGDHGYLMNMFFMYGFLTQWAERVLPHPNVQKLLKSGEKFDVVIVEQFLHDALKVLASEFDAPVIVVSTIPANIWVNNLVANPSPTSYIPTVLSKFPERMDFIDRLLNTLDSFVQNCILQLYYYPLQAKLAREHLPQAKDFHEVLYNASLVLLNSHPSMNQAVPHVPNMIEIGGYHIKEPKKLPDDLQTFLDDAKDGVVYFSMGSNLRSAQMSAENRDAILRTFSQLKQKILWKWEEDELPGQPANVRIDKWLPQQDILNHPNVKLFISHGGMSSTVEAMNFGVPMLGIPVYGDQLINIRTAVDFGMALALPYAELNERNFAKALRMLLEDEKFGKNAKYRAELFHDRLVPPMDEAIYWVEYVARHKGAPHLRVEGLDLPWYQYLLLDVIAFLTLIGLVSLYVNYLIAKVVLRLFKSKTGTKKVKKN